MLYTFTMRYIGIDYGAKRVGLAFSDEAGTMGFPHSVVPNTPTLADDIIKLLEKERVNAVVIGESKTLSEEDNPITKDIHAFGEALGTRTGLPVYYEDERLTSAEARRAPGTSRVLDASAAAHILTSFLEKQHDNHR
jgi:putative Holliday junction resolvase